MAVFKNELHLDAKQHNSEMNKAADSAKKVDKQIREAEKGTRQYLAAQKNAARKAAEHAKQMDVLSGKLGKLASAFGANSTAANVFGDVVTKGIGSALKFSTGLAAVTLALKVGKDAFFNNESGIDNWGRTVKGAEGAYDGFINTLNNGDWGNFFTNLREAINGAQRLYNLFDSLGSTKLNNSAAIAILQNKIAELKLLQSAGQDVSDALKTASNALAKLQNESVSKGKLANAVGIYNELHNRDTNITDKDIRNARKRILEDGQSYFDEQASIYKRLNAKATTTVTKYGMYGSTYTETKTDYSKLTKAEQAQLRVAKAVTEAETKLQPYIEGYASVVQESTSSLKEQKKALGGTTPSTPKASTSKNEPTINVKPLPEVEIIAALDFKVDELPKVEIPADLNIQYNLNDLEKSVTKFFNNFTVDKEWLNIDDLDAYISKCIDLGKTYEELQNNLKKIAELNKDAFAFNELGSSIEALGNSISTLGGRAADMIGTLVVSVGKIFSLVGQVMAFAAAQAIQNAFALPFPANIAAYATVLGMISSAIGIVGGVVGKFADGGIVGGTTTVGDYNLARVNGGEMILNKAQQNHLFNMINANNSTNGNTFNSGKVEFKIKGKELIGVLNNYNKQLNRI